MKYFRNTTEIAISEGTVISLGKFDGLHSGHRYLLQELLHQKERLGGKSVIFTFSTPPRDEIEKKKHKVLLTLEEKEFIFEQAGIDYLIEYPFTQDVMKMSAEDFVDMIVKRLNVKAFIVGTDYYFGYQRKGDYHLLEELSSQYGFDVIVVNKKQYHGEDISSTLIRNCIKQDNLLLANELLGFPFFVQGSVEEGNHIGRTIGIPTINLLPAEEKLLPSNGVYASTIFVNNQEYKGITNIGKKPTVGDDNPIGVETHIFDFNKNVYGQKVRVTLLEKVRDERKFSSVEELKNQIQDDICRIKAKYYEVVT